MTDDVVFLLDVDNTLLDNDSVAADLQTHLHREFGKASGDLYWIILEQLRNELGYTDYLGALQRFRLATAFNPRILEVSTFLVDYPFSSRLYPGSLETIHHLRQWGPTVILSDGDVVFQPRKVQRSGLWEAVEGRVLVYIHKDEMLDDVKQRYPAHHYVMVDDKLRILDSMKRSWRDQLTTVFPRQGHYANDAKLLAAFPPPDIAVDRISALIDYDLRDLLDHEEQKS